MEPVFSDFSGTKKHFSLTKPRAKRIIRVLREFKSLGNCKVLDAGCGYGAISLELAKKCSRVVGIDVNERTVRGAKENAKKSGRKNVSFRAENSEKLSFNPGKFDIVVSYQVLEHVNNQKKYLRELKRVMKGNGVLYLATPNRFWPIEPHYKVPFLALMPGFLSGFFTRRRGVKEYDIKLLSSGSLQGLLCESGFEFVDFTGRIVKDPEKFSASEDFGGKMKLLKHLYFFPFSAFVPGFIFVCSKSPLKRR